ncbi:MAG: M61 family metallopeptidase, partial [Xanthobacteraceae bacterium]
MRFQGIQNIDFFASFRILFASIHDGILASSACYTRLLASLSIIFLAMTAHHPHRRLKTLAARSATSIALALTLALPARADVPAPVDQPYPGTIVLNVDATNLAQQVFQMRMSIPVKPGPLTLLYPQWLPANHGPNGPITQLAGL